jgi:hypothetical protein
MQALCLHTGQHNIEKCGHTSMPRVGFKPTIPVFEQLKYMPQTTQPLGLAGRELKITIMEGSLVAYQVS